MSCKTHALALFTYLKCVFENLLVYLHMMAVGDIFMEFELADSDGELSLKGEDSRSKRKGSPLSSNEPAKKQCCVEKV